MAPVSYARHQFPPAIIQHAVWLYLRFSLSYRDVEDLLAERGLDVSYETVRRWVRKFGVLFARELRKRRASPSAQWHLDELVVVIGGKRFFLWRAVDSEGEVLDLLVQRRRDKTAAVTFLRKVLKKQRYTPEVMVTDKLRSYGAAKAQIGLSARHEQGLRQEQPGRKLASAHPAAGAQDAAVQVTRIGPTLPCRTRHRLQHIQYSASSHLAAHASPLEGRRDGAMAHSHCGEVKTVRNQHLSG